MDEVEGETVEEWVRRLHDTQLPPNSIEVEQFARRMGSLIHDVHGTGLVHGDLKSTNVIVASDGELSLIDFELSGSVGAPRSGADIGTRGYLSPNARTGGPLGEGDDWYAAAALLAMVATGVEPSRVPIGLESYDLALIAPWLPTSLLERIHAALDDPSELAFARCGSSADSTILPATDPTQLGPPQKIESVVLAARSYSAQIGTALCSRSIRSASGLAWESTHELASGQELRFINSGVAGTILGLAAIAQVSPEESILAALTDAVKHLTNQAWPHARLPGLFVGEAGVALCILRAGLTVRDEELIAEGIRRCRQVSDLHCASPDFFHGRAGRLLLNLECYRLTGERIDLRLARDEAVAIRESVLELGTGLGWPIPSEYEGLGGRVFLGFAHGTAGIVYALLRFREVVGSEEFEEVASRGLRTLQDSAIWRGPCALWPAEIGGVPRPPLWCHGSGGISQTLCLASVLGGSTWLRDFAVGAGYAIASRARWANPTLCHGLAGSICSLLALSEVFGESALRSAAAELFIVLERHLVAESPREVYCGSESPDVVTPDYAVGFAGVGALVARISQEAVVPMSSPHTLLVMPSEWADVYTATEERKNAGFNSSP